MINHAYRSKDIEAYLQEQGCESYIHEKGYRGHPLTKHFMKTEQNVESRI